MNRFFWLACGFVAGVIVRGNAGSVTHPTGGAVLLGCLLLWWLLRRASATAVASATATATATAVAEANAQAESKAAAIAQAAVHLHMGSLERGGWPGLDDAGRRDHLLEESRSTELDSRRELWRDTRRAEAGELSHVDNLT